MIEQTFNLSSTNDDVVDWLGYGGGNSTTGVGGGTNELGLGRWGGVITWTGFRFVTTLPQGLTIQSAYLRAYLVGTHANQPHITFKCEDVDDAAAIDSGTSIGNRTLTEAFNVEDTTTHITDFETPGWYDFDVTNGLQKVLRRPGYAAGSHINVVAYCDVDGDGGQAQVFVEDFSHSGGHHAQLVVTFSDAPLIVSGPTEINSGQSGVTFTGLFLDSATSVSMIGQGVSQPQTITAQNSTSITITCVPGTVPYGPVVLRTSNGVDYTDHPVTYIPIAGNGYAIMTNPALDSSSLEFEAEPAGVDNDVFEWQEAAVFSVNFRGRYSRIANSVDDTITYRRWSAVTQTFSDWETMTISPNAYVADIQSSVLVNEIDEALGHIDVLANAVAGEWPIDATTVEAVSAPLHASTFTINPTTGVITYLPVNGYAGVDTFTYRVRDTQGTWSNVGTVTISVVWPPLANDLTTPTVAYNTPMVITLADLVNAGKVSPVYGGSLSIIAVSAGSHCRAAVVNSNTITLTPDYNYAGIMSATYTVQESGSNAAATGTISVTVLPVTASAPHIRYFNATSQVQLTVTRTSLNISDSVIHTVTVN